jgi:hypothetical protein
MMLTPAFCSAPLRRLGHRGALLAGNGGDDGKPAALQLSSRLSDSSISAATPRILLLLALAKGIEETKCASNLKRFSLHMLSSAVVTNSSDL